MKRTLTLILLLLLLVLGLFILAMGCSGNEDPAAEEPEITIETIVARLQPILELSTLKVSVSGIVNATQPSKHWWQGDSRLVLLVRGEALYSIDLSCLKVNITDNRVSLSLPPPRVAEAWVDVEQSTIWKREIGRFRSEEQVKLEEEAWHAAKQLVEDGADNERHRQLAMTRTEIRITEILHQFDADLQVEFLWQDAPVVHLA